MHLFFSVLKRGAGLALALALFSVGAVLAQGTSSLRGVVKDEFGGSIIGATVVVTGRMARRRPRRPTTRARTP